MPATENTTSRNRFMALWTFPIASWLSLRRSTSDIFWLFTLNDFVFNYITTFLPFYCRNFAKVLYFLQKSFTIYIILQLALLSNLPFLPIKDKKSNPDSIENHLKPDNITTETFTETSHITTETFRNTTETLLKISRWHRYDTKATEVSRIKHLLKANLFIDFFFILFSFPIFVVKRRQFHQE